MRLPRLRSVSPRIVNVAIQASTVVLLLSLAAGLFFSRHWRVVNDASQLSYCAFMVRHGFAPYRQLFEMNMPGIYMLFLGLQRIFGQSELAIHAVDWLLMLVAVLSMVSVAREQRAAGFFGGALFALYHMRDGAGQLVQRDMIVAVLLLAGYALYFAALRSRRPWMFFFGAACASSAAAFKPTPFLFSFILLGFAVARWRKVHRTGTAAVTLLGLAGIAAPVGAVLVFLHHYHAVHSFIGLLRTVLPYYAQLGRMDIGTLSIVGETSSVRTLVLLAAICALCMRDRWRDWENEMLLLGIFFGIASYFAQHKGFNYHRYPMLAFMFLWSSLQVFAALSRTEKPWLQWLAFATLIFGTINAPIYAYRTKMVHWSDDFMNALAEDLNAVGGQSLSGHVQCLYTLAECDTTLYRMQLVQSTGMMYDFFLLNPPISEANRQARSQFWQDIHQQPPRVIVLGRGAFPAKVLEYGKLDSWPELEDFLAQNYVLQDERKFKKSEGGPLGFRLYILRIAYPQSTAAAQGASHYEARKYAHNPLRSSEQ